MVLSLAFIMAFIGAAISLLLGILIFGEVSDSLFIEAPELIAEESIIIDSIWQYREVKTSGINAACQMFPGGGGMSLGTIASKVHTCIFFKSFPTEYLDDTRIFVNWRGAGNDLTNQATARLKIVNAEYTRNNFTEIPSSNPVPRTSGIATEVSFTDRF